LQDDNEDIDVEDDGEDGDDDEESGNEDNLLQLGELNVPANDPAKLEEASSVENAEGELQPSLEVRVDENGNDIPASRAQQEEAKEEAKGDAAPAAPAKKVDPVKKVKDQEKTAAKKAKQESDALSKPEGGDGGDKKAEDYSKPGTLPFTDLWGSDIRYSDQIANGDDDDDKELEDEDDPNDLIVDDNGFVGQWDLDASKVPQWVQLDSEINMGNQKSMKTLQKVQVDEKAKFSDELVDGEQEDDKEVSDLIDNDDDEVDENLGLEESSLLQLYDSEFDGVHGRGFSNPGPAW
jgi:hypothetical protein